MIGALYGLLGLLGFTLAVWSTNRALVAGASIMLTSWAISNAAVIFFGFDGSPLIIPAADGILAIVAAYVAVQTRNRALMVVFALFVLEAATHVAFLLFHQGATISYAIALNAVYSAQVLVVGASGVREAMAYRASWRHSGFVDLAGTGRRGLARVAGKPEA